MEISAFIKKIDEQRKKNTEISRIKEQKEANIENVVF